VIRTEGKLGHPIEVGVFGSVEFMIYFGSASS